MCLAVSGQVLEIIDEFNAKVEVDGVTITVCTTLLPDIKEGAFVLVHAGFAIEEINREAAEENIRTWRQLLEVRV